MVMWHNAVDTTNIANRKSLYLKDDKNRCPVGQKMYGVATLNSYERVFLQPR